MPELASVKLTVIHSQQLANQSPVYLPYCYCLSVRPSPYSGRITALVIFCIQASCASTAHTLHSCHCCQSSVSKNLTLKLPMVPYSFFLLGILHLQPVYVELNFSEFLNSSNNRMSLEEDPDENTTSHLESAISLRRPRILGFQKQMFFKYHNLGFQECLMLLSYSIFVDFVR